MSAYDCKKQTVVPYITFPSTCSALQWDLLLLSAVLLSRTWYLYTTQLMLLFQVSEASAVEGSDIGVSHCTGRHWCSRIRARGATEASPLLLSRIRFDSDAYD